MTDFDNTTVLYSTFILTLNIKVMRWGPFQTGEIKRSEPSDIDNYEITIFYESSLLLVPTAFFWQP